MTDATVTRILTSALQDPGAYAGNKGKHVLSAWLTDAVLKALDHNGYAITKKPGRGACASPVCFLVGTDLVERRACAFPDRCPETR